MDRQAAFHRQPLHARLALDLLLADEKLRIRDSSCKKGNQREHAGERSWFE